MGWEVRKFGKYFLWNGYLAVTTKAATAQQMSGKTDLAYMRIAAFLLQAR